MMVTRIGKNKLFYSQLFMKSRTWKETERRENLSLICPEEQQSMLTYPVVVAEWSKTLVQIQVAISLLKIPVRIWYDIIFK